MSSWSQNTSIKEDIRCRHFFSLPLASRANGLRVSAVVVGMGIACRTSAAESKINDMGVCYRTHTSFTELFLCCDFFSMVACLSNPCPLKMKQTNKQKEYFSNLARFFELLFLFC
jgi:hypothetical protein